MPRTQQNWSLCMTGSHMTTTPLLGPTRIPRGLGIDPGICSELVRIGVWSNRGSCDIQTTPRTNPHPKSDSKLILGLMRPPQWHQQPPGRTLVHKPSLKFHRPNSLDCRARHGIPVTNLRVYVLTSCHHSIPNMGAVLGVSYFD